MAVHEAGTSNVDISGNINDGEAETTVEKYSYSLNQLQFEKAREYVEEQRLQMGKTANATDRNWYTLLSLLTQLVTNEAAYFAISFFSTKFSFRKESHLKDSYAQLRSELSRIAEDTRGALEVPVLSLLHSLAHDFASFAKARTSLIEFYTDLTALDWSSIGDDHDAKLDEIQQCVAKPLTKSDAIGAADLVRREVDVLQQALAIQRSILQFKMLDTLILLKAFRDMLTVWFKEVEDGQPIRHTPSFLRVITKNSRPMTKFALLHWFELLYHSLLAKFSLYFHDVLAPFSVDSELKAAFTAPGSMIQLCQSFGRKSGPKLICAIVNRMDCQEPFFGFGYNKLLSNFPTSESYKPATGINEKFPPLFYMPADKRLFESLHPDVTSFVQDASQKNGDGKVQYLLDRSKDAKDMTRAEKCFFGVHVEANINLVIVFDRKMHERDNNVIGFLNDFVGGIRGTRLFQELRTIAKA